MKTTVLLAGASLLLASNAYASDGSFAEGKKLFQDNCLACHDAQLDPPQAPPMFAVQMKYKMATPGKASFVDKVTSFATHPTKEKAILKKPVKVLGLMPDMGFEESDVRKIAAYLHDETFAPPCNHWKVALRITKEKNDMKHHNKIKQRYNAMCSEKPETTEKHAKPSMPTTSAAEEGTLKYVMQQLGKDYTALDHAILMEDFDRAAKAANHIANHDKPSMWQKMKIMGGLRTDMPNFKKADEKVHNLALDIEKAAKAKDMPQLIQQQSKMLSACMGCHTAYRTKVMDFLK